MEVLQRVSVSVPLLGRRTCWSPEGIPGSSSEAGSHVSWGERYFLNGTKKPHFLIAQLFV